MTISIIMLMLAFALPTSMLLIARIAIGVAAFPKPSIFALMFIVMNLLVSADDPGNRNFTTGRKSFASRFEIPVFSNIEKNPSHNAYSAQSRIAKFTASKLPFVIAVTAVPGLAISSAARDEAIRIVQIFPIRYNV